MVKIPKITYTIPVLLSNSSQLLWIRYQHYTMRLLVCIEANFKYVWLDFRSFPGRSSGINYQWGKV